MRNHLVTANLNILSGLLQGTMEFTPGLNIISGENGTLKTQLLHALRGGAAVASEPGVALRMQTFSPTRNSGAPRINMSKNRNVEFPIEALSMGEQEVLSLILSVNTSRENVDVYLIDEPEVHLNWHLEERLFAFLDDFCTKAKSMPS